MDCKFVVFRQKSTSAMFTMMQGGSKPLFGAWRRATAGTGAGTGTRAGGSGGFQQRRTVVSLPRLTLSLLRVPLAAAGAGMGTAAYIHYRVKEFSHDVVPEWLRERAQRAREWIDSVDLSTLRLPEFGFALPDLDSVVDLRLPESLPPLSIPLSVDVSEIAKRVDRAKAAIFGQGSASASDSSSPAGLQAAHDSLDSPTIHPASASASASPTFSPQGNQDLLGLTSKLIEIRNLLKSIDTGTSALTLPSIVVVGSQSSGKSSVLEAVVGHEFLPKGSNMVTRRPIELTLIHTPDSKEEYSVFPQLGPGKVKDFAQVRRTLTDLNLAVSESDCVSDVPIELRVYSPNVPDLSLVDLPGYIQIHTKDQPPILKEKIAALCQKYIQEPNIILAVCAADVDLANSEALRASRKVDPLGLRTIGVITKMDLVDPETGVAILENKNYPLALGYIGVVNNKSSARSFSQALIRSEDSFFRSHPEYNNSTVGTTKLRTRLMKVLEEHMGRSLHSIVDAVQMELDNARYEFKVHYNDRRISAESYVAESMDILKQRFKVFTQDFGKPQVRDHILAMLDQKLLKVCSDVYWSDELISQLPRESLANPYWQNKLDISSGSLTKSGIGKATVQLVVDLITSKMEDLTSTQPWIYHENARRQVSQFSTEILRSKFHTTVDQVENTIKPYKFEVESTDLEWRNGQKRAVSILESQIARNQTDLQTIKSAIGRRRLRNAIKQLNRIDRNAAAASTNATSSSLDTSAADQDTPASSSFSFSSLFSSDADDVAPAGLNTKLLERARQALELQSGITMMQQRLSAVRSRQCASSENKVACPEVYLSVVSEKLAYTAVMFIYIELLNEFFFHLPREMDNKLYYGLNAEQIRQFARENPSIRKHLEIQDRKATLELAMEKLKELKRR
eukprot:jgi/Hompol1/601/HPOL_002544-RA